jgi:hypothetical protein
MKGGVTHFCHIFAIVLIAALSIIPPWLEPIFIRKIISHPPAWGGPACMRALHGLLDLLLGLLALHLRRARRQRRQACRAGRRNDDLAAQLLFDQQAHDGQHDQQAHDAENTAHIKSPGVSSLVGHAQAVHPVGQGRCSFSLPAAYIAFMAAWDSRLCWLILTLH